MPLARKPGVILLFERPAQVGDAVDIGNISGVIERIGIRASIVRLESGATVIVPDSGFITQRVTNRALTNLERLLEIRVDVAYGVNFILRVRVDHPNKLT